MYASFCSGEIHLHFHHASQHTLEPKIRKINPLKFGSKVCKAQGTPPTYRIPHRTSLPPLTPSEHSCLLRVYLGDGRLVQRGAAQT